MTNSTRTSLLLALALTCAWPTASSAGLTGPKGETHNEKRDAIRRERDEILAKLYQAHPEAKSKMDKAAGYATFNNKSLKLVLLSAGTGYGLAVVHHLDMMGVPVLNGADSISRSELCDPMEPYVMFVASVCRQVKGGWSRDSSGQA